MKRVISLPAIAVLFLSACARPQAAPTPADDCRGQLLFQGYRDGKLDVYRMDADGANLVNLTNDPSLEKASVWSPDGKQIAYTSDRGGETNIYIMPFDGSRSEHLVDFPEGGDSPSWSPDGEHLAFESWRNGGGDIYKVNTDGSDIIQLTDTGWNLSPAWSPDGGHIAFISTSYDLKYGDYVDDIQVMEPDGSNLINLTQGRGEDFLHPTWSPDGKRIAFESSLGTGWGFSFMDVDRLNLSEATGPIQGRNPAWSPDGERIAFVSSDGGSDGLYVMDTDGSDVIRLTQDPGSDLMPAWSPDGKCLAYENLNDGHWDIRVVQTDGSLPSRSVIKLEATELERLAYTPDPKWRPWDIP